MSLRKRIAAVERKTGVSQGVPVAYFRTIYEDANGEPESETCLASLFPGARRHETLASEENETFEAFEQRVQAHCLKHYGSIPKND